MTPSLRSSNIEEVEAALAALRRAAEAMYLHDSDGGISMTTEEFDAAWAGQVLAGKSYPDVLALLERPEAALRLGALRVLTLLACRPGQHAYPAPPPELGPTLAPLLASADARVCLLTLQALRYAAGPYRAEVRALLRHADPYVCRMATLVLRGLGGRKGDVADPDDVAALEATLSRAPALVSLALLGLQPGYHVDLAALRAGFDEVLPRYPELEAADEDGEPDGLDFHGLLAQPAVVLDRVLHELPDARAAEVLALFAGCLDGRAYGVVRFFHRVAHPPALDYLNQAVLVAELRHTAVDALERRPDVRSLPSLLRAFDDCDSLWLRARIGLLAVELGCRTLAPQLIALHRALDHDQPRAQVLRALGRDGGTDALAYLRELRPGGAETASALTAALARHDPLAEIAKLAAESPTKTRVRDLCAIDRIEIYPVLLRWFKAAQGELLRDIPFAIGLRQDPRAVPTLITMFELRPAYPAQYDLVLALGKCRGLDYLRTLAHAPRTRDIFQYNLITAFAHIGGDAGRRELELMQKSADKDGKKRIQRELARLGGSRSTPGKPRRKR